MNAHVLLRDYVRAREIAPYGDDVEVGRVTRELVDHGHYILQSHKLAASDFGHVAELLNYFDPPQGARVLDAGCGVGAVAELMAEIRPDLQFTLLNISAAQLALAPAGMDKVCADMHALPFSDGSFDAVVFNYSLGHGLLDRCIAEGKRVLRPGGVLFIYDLTASDSDRQCMFERVGYKPHLPYEVLEAADLHGMALNLVMAPDGSTDQFIGLIGEEAFAALGFDRAWPMIYRFTKVSA